MTTSISWVFHRFCKSARSARRQREKKMERLHIDGFSLAPELVGYSAPRDLHRRAAYSICESWFLIHQDVYHDLFVCS